MPDDLGNSLLSTAVAKAVETGVEETFKLLHTLLDAPLGEAGEYLRQVIADRRAARRHTLLAKVGEKIHEVGFEPRSVPDTVIIPLLEAATLEDEPTLQDMWANLLANAADPRKCVIVTGQYVSILRELSASDASFFKRYVEGHRKTHAGPSDALDNAAFGAGISSRRPGVFGKFGGYESPEEQQRGKANIALTVDNLCRVGIMEKISQVDAVDSRQVRDLVGKIVKHNTVGTLKLDTELTPGLTQLGRAFYEAVLPPSKS